MRNREYEEWLKRVIKAGRELRRYACPTCGGTNVSLKPEPGDTYTTMAECPECSGLHFRLARADGTVEVDGEGVWSWSPE